MIAQPSSSVISRPLLLPSLFMFFVFFFFNDTATTEIYTLSLHDALPICEPDLVIVRSMSRDGEVNQGDHVEITLDPGLTDRKSTRLNSSHLVISYAVFCLKKKTLTTDLRIL